MRRRTILANTGTTLAASLCGCLGAVSREESPDNRIDKVATDTAPDLSLVPSFSAISPESTVDGPMSIRVKWENEQQETVRFGEERSAMFHAVKSDDEGAHLLSDDYGTWDEAVSLDECWYVSGEIGGDAALSSP